MMFCEKGFRRNIRLRGSRAFVVSNCSLLYITEKKNCVPCRSDTKCAHERSYLILIDHQYTWIIAIMGEWGLMNERYACMQNYFLLTI